jgi:hypothetical protein
MSTAVLPARSPAAPAALEPYRATITKLDKLDGRGLVPYLRVTFYGFEVGDFPVRLLPDGKLDMSDVEDNGRPVDPADIEVIN